MDKKLRLEIRMENAAFTGDPGAEAARILRKMAHELEEYGHLSFEGLYDYNGNKVGWAVIDGDG